MSRIGKRPIALPQGVDVQYAEREVHIKGPKGEHHFKVPQPVEIELSSEELKVVADYRNDRTARCMMGTVQSVLSNMVQGVSVGFTRKLQLVGVGYRAAVQGRNVEMALGFSHPVSFALPEGISAEVENNTLLTISGHDNAAVGQVAANIRRLRPPEPYQGKGISYQGEQIRRKAGKSGKK